MKMSRLDVLFRLLMVLVSFNVLLGLPAIDDSTGTYINSNTKPSDPDHPTVLFKDEHNIESQSISNFYLAISILITVVLSGIIEVGQALFG